MPLKFGLNVPSKAAAPVRRGILDDDDDDDDDVGRQDASGPVETAIEEISFVGGPPSTSRPPPPKAKPLPPKQQRNAAPKSIPESRENRSAIAAAQRSIAAAEEVDPSIFDYDSFYDAKASVAEQKKEAARQDAIERKPKYIANLLDAAARRKQDQQIAREKVLQREREAEGDEFADKEKFVTSAYKQQQEETRRLEEEEKNKAEAEARRKNLLGTGGGMQTFYKNMMESTERQHQEAMEAASRADLASDSSVTQKREKTDQEIAAEARAKGIQVHTNEEGQIVDKRELLSAGLNIGVGTAGGAHAADHLRSDRGKSRQSAFEKYGASSGKQQQQQATRERQSRMIEEQLELQAKRAREEEEEERARLEKAARSTKTEKDISDAKAKYLARKAAKERGEG